MKRTVVVPGINTPKQNFHLEIHGSISLLLCHQTFIFVFYWDELNETDFVLYAYSILIFTYISLKIPERWNGRVLVLTSITELSCLGAESSAYSPRKQLTCFFLCIMRFFQEVSSNTTESCYMDVVVMKSLSLNPLFCLFISQRFFLSSSSSEFTLLFFCTDSMWIYFQVAVI